MTELKQALDKATATFGALADTEYELSVATKELESLTMRVMFLENADADKDQLHRARTKRSIVERKVGELTAQLRECKKASYAANLQYLYEVM